MFKSLYRSQPVRQFGQTISRTHHSCDVQTEIPVHIILGRGQDNILIILLNIGNPGSNLLFYLIIHKDNRTCHDMVTLPFLFSDILLHQKTDSLRTVGKPFSFTYWSKDSNKLSSKETPKRFKDIYSFLLKFRA